MQVQYCYWPPLNATKKIQKLELPDKENWAKHRVRVFAKTGISFYLKDHSEKNITATTVNKC